MNRYSLAADSRRWWWLPAAAGTVGTAVVTSILVVSTTSATTVVDVPAPGSGTTGSATDGSVIVVERPCYLARPEWNTPQGLEHPVCETVVGRRVGATWAGVRRPWLEYQP